MKMQLQFLVLTNTVSLKIDYTSQKQSAETTYSHSNAKIQNSSKLEKIIPKQSFNPSVDNTKAPSS